MTSQNSRQNSRHDSCHDSSQERAFFGRRAGQGLRPGQSRLIGELLPKLRLPEGALPRLEELFADPVREVRLEIGFGGAEHLLSAAKAAPNIGFIGVEPFINGMAKALSVIEAENITNIRLWDDDASLLLKRIPDAALAQVDLFYPDPWPKRRQRKRRFVSDATLEQIARVLKPGCAFRFATDIDDYAGWTLARLLRSPSLTWSAEKPRHWLTPLEGWVRTRYETKAILAGRVPSYITAIRNGAD